jgi:predicted RNA binding protein YcfA (HicA-like mRNA interferase family)
LRLTKAGRLYRDRCAEYPTPKKIGEVLDLLKRDGWYLAATKGSHRQFKHSDKPGRVTVAGKPSDDLAPGTLNSIFKQAGLKK